jgi:hypothetical protein
VADKKKFIVTDGPIHGDHQRYLNGDVIELEPKDSKRLLAEKKVEPFKKSKEE